MGVTKNNTGGHFKIRGTGKNSNMRGHTKFLGGFEKEEARFSGGLLQRGVAQKNSAYASLFYAQSENSNDITPVK